jgi:RNA recognition motif-containing protein
MKLLVRNLDRNTTEAELRTLFEAFGKVQSCTVVMDVYTNKSKGFGFVEMPSPGESKAAVVNLNGKEVGSNRIRVKRSAPEPGAAKDKAQPSE